MTIQDQLAAVLREGLPELGICERLGSRAIVHDSSWSGWDHLAGTLAERLVEKLPGLCISEEVTAEGVAKWNPETGKYE